jgi:hypothetical protein
MEQSKWFYSITCFCFAGQSLGITKDIIKSNKTDKKSADLLHIITELFSFHIQRDSKRWTQFRTSIFPELYMVREWSTKHLKEEVLNFQIPPIESSPSAQLCSSVSWDSVLMNSRTQKILCCILLSTDAAARLCVRWAL